MLFALRYLLHPVTKEKFIDIDFSMEVQESELPTLIPTLDNKVWRYRASDSEISIPPQDRYVGLVRNYQDIQIFPIEEWNPDQKLLKGTTFANLVRLSDTNIKLTTLKQEFRPRAKKDNPRSHRLHCFFPTEMIYDFDIPQGKKLYEIFKRGLAKRNLYECPYHQSYKKTETKDFTFGITKKELDKLAKLKKEDEAQGKLILKIVYNGLISPTSSETIKR